jgi:prevent-host-death family protein
MEVNVHEAKTNFSKLLQRVILGDEIIIAKAGVPVAKLVRYVSKKGKRPLGFLKGEIWMADDFDAPLPPDILAGFLGEKEP